MCDGTSNEWDMPHRTFDETCLNNDLLLTYTNIYIYDTQIKHKSNLTNILIHCSY